MRISFDASFDLSNSAHCCCHACCEAFSALFYAAAEEVAAEEGTEIEVHPCTYNSPDTQGCDTSDEAVETWQAIHDRISWTKRDWPAECESKQWTIDVDEGKLDGVSGYRHHLVVQPEERRVYLFECIGAGTPVDVWHSRAIALSLPLKVDGEQVADCLKAHKEQLNVIADSYLGSRWDGNNHVGRWDDEQDDARRDAADEIERALSELPTYWDAGEWLSTDAHSAIMEAGVALESGQSLAEWAEAEVDRRASDALLCAGELPGALLQYVRDDPEGYLVSDEEYIEGAAQLAELAGIDLPPLDTDDDDDDDEAQKV